MSARPPRLIQKFINMLWVNLSIDWNVRFLYQKENLYVTIKIPIPKSKKYLRMKRLYKLQVIESRKNDIWGLASDCADEIKSEIKRANNGNKRKER